MRLAFWTVNQRMPALSKISVCGSFASGSGILYSVTAPVFGSSLPINAPVFPVYQMLPPPSSTRPCGPEWVVFNGYSLILPLFGSTRPSTLAIWPVYQSDPSLAASGSCGRQPGVASCRPRALGGRPRGRAPLPLLHRDLDRSRDHRAGGLGLLRKVLGQIFRDW